MKDYDSTSLSARRWSEQVLGISDGVDRIRLLKRLTEFDYVVPADQVDAMQILVNPLGPSLRPQTLERADREGRRDRQTSAVASFAHSYFKVPVSERRGKWTTLRHQCDQCPALLRWLDDLAPALDLERAPRMGDEVLNHLIELCCQTYVAREPARARQRQEIILTCCQNPNQWLAPVRRLAAEEPRFTAQVAPWLKYLPDTINLERHPKGPLSPVREPVRPKSIRQKILVDWVGYLIMAAPIAICLIIAVKEHLDPSRTDHNSSPSVQRQHRFDSAKEQAKLREVPRILQQIQRRKVGETIWPRPAKADQPPDIPPPPSLPED